MVLRLPVTTRLPAWVLVLVFRAPLHCLYRIIQQTQLLVWPDHFFVQIIITYECGYCLVCPARPVGSGFGYRWLEFALLASTLPCTRFPGQSLFLPYPRTAVSSERLQEIMVLCRFPINQMKDGVTETETSRIFRWQCDLSLSSETWKSVLHHFLSRQNLVKQAAFIGSTGSGKSSLVRGLIPRFYDVTCFCLLMV